jgi:general secretion pathway protein A
MAKIKTPFSTSADPTSLLKTAEVENAIGRARYAVDARQGLTAIIGDVGLGKTSILRFLWHSYQAQEDCAVAMIPTADFRSPYGLIKAICAEFRISGKRSKEEQLVEFNKFVAARMRDERNVVIFIDEAQKLDSDKLELIRTLINLEQPGEKLVQIVLAGQLELRDMLVKKENEALYQRLYAPTLLNPLSRQDTISLIEARCRDAQIKNPFTEEAMHRVYDITAGVPRRILSLCGQSYEMMLRTPRARTIGPELVSAVFRQGDLKGELKDVA